MLMLEQDNVFIKNREIKLDCVDECWIAANKKIQYIKYVCVFLYYVVCTINLIKRPYFFQNVNMGSCKYTLIEYIEHNEKFFIFRFGFVTMKVYTFHGDQLL